MDDTVNKKQLIMFQSEQESVDHRSQCPEYKLWTAVMTRAITDYVKFFDQWIVIDGQNIRMSKTKKRRKTLRTKQSLELNWLRWFLFSDSSQEFNLAWVFEHCLHENESSLKTTRKNLIKFHVQNLEKNKTCSCLTEVYDLYQKYGPMADISDKIEKQKLN